MLYCKLLLLDCKKLLHLDPEKLLLQNLFPKLLWKSVAEPAVLKADLKT